MMSREISFRELAKRIHPDTNPHIQDAGGKMTQAIRMKNHPEELYKLAIRWGVSDLQRPQQTETVRPQPRHEVKYGWVQHVNDTPVVGDHVVITTVKGGLNTKVIRTTPTRVYYFHNDRRRFALKKSVYVVRWGRVG